MSLAYNIDKEKGRVKYYWGQGIPIYSSVVYADSYFIRDVANNRSYFAICSILMDFEYIDEFDHIVK